VCGTAFDEFGPRTQPLRDFERRALETGRRVDARALLPMPAEPRPTEGNSGQTQRLSTNTFLISFPRILGFWPGGVRRGVGLSYNYFLPTSILICAYGTWICWISRARDFFGRVSKSRISLRVYFPKRVENVPILVSVRANSRKNM